MKKKMPETLHKIDRFAEAAAKARVPVEVFRMWSLRTLRGISTKQWSHWETGHRPIPDKHIVAFLLALQAGEVDLRPSAATPLLDVATESPERLRPSPKRKRG